MFSVNVYIYSIYIYVFLHTYPSCRLICSTCSIDFHGVFFPGQLVAFCWFFIPQKWMAFRRPCALVSKHGGWDVGLPYYSCCQCTNEVPDWDKAHDTLAPISGWPEKTWNTALSHGEKNWPGLLMGLIIKGIYTIPGFFPPFSLWNLKTIMTFHFTGCLIGIFIMGRL